MSNRQYFIPFLLPAAVLLSDIHPAAAQTAQLLPPAADYPPCTLLGAAGSAGAFYLLIPVILVLVILWALLLRWQIDRKSAALLQEIGERKLVEKALAKSEAKFRALYENAPLPYQSLDDTGCLVGVNKAWLATMGGYGRDEVIGRPFADFLAAGEGPAINSGGGVIRDIPNSELRMVKKNGQEILVRYTGRIHYDDGGKFQHIHGILQDITAPRQAAAELADQQRLLEMLVNTVPGILCLKDAKGRWLLTNDYTLQLFQLAGVDYRAMTAAELAAHSDFYRDLITGCQTADNEAWEGGVPVQSEETIPLVDGFIKFFDITRIPMFDDLGRRKLLLVVGHDITRRRANEEKIRLGKQEWEETFDAMPDIITLQDKDMKIIRANKAFYDTFQAPPAELIGKKCYEIFRGSDHPCANCPEMSVINGKTGESAKIRHETLGRIFQVASSAVLNDNGEIIRLVHIAKDITSQEKLAEELFQAHKMEAIGTLAGGIAHDFNNILAVILGYADMIRETLPAASVAAEDIGRVIEAANRAKELVRQILTFSRKGRDTQEPLQPAPIIKETLKLLRASLPATIEIHEEIDNDCGVIIANPINIHQIVLNLCTNAMQAMADEKGVLTVTLHRVQADDMDAAVVELLVSDTGCGIDEDTKSHIFEPYFTTKGVGKGTGMGLALVHGIVQECGGSIKVESKPGAGSAFRLSFPIVQEDGIKDAVEEQLAPLPKGRERILAVDDEEAITNVYRQTLTALGYEISVFSDSVKLFEKFQAAPADYDLIITDQTMPHLTGSELAEKILRIRPDIPIILCTGYSNLISRETADKIGVTRFLLKPVSRRELAATVRDVLDNCG